MLEVKHLCKTYKPKKGTETRALDDVSINFPETGLVFLLGKSGSGKSTLLNICGGLDRADSGEIIIMGKSSADFTPTDFDSYRNTFIGFIFQEYNILNEFTVEDNIALALELQNKKRDPEKIAEILKSVDLEEFAKRKPNTLSGGQKQRVAIARALVKEPRIIFADEPTGALDSGTGKQVLDTLKKLSANKLVIVVSHDREFAELYADRIIELKDGKVISDISRTGETKEVPNVQLIGQNTISVRDGSALTDEDLQNIKRFLSVSKSGVIVSNEPQIVQKTQEAGVEEQSGTFSQTTEQPCNREYTEKERTMIRSKMPVRHAFRMGAASVRLKPVRLTFTILLSTIAFIMFGIFSTVMLYDAQSVTVQSLKNSGYEYINYTKAYKAHIKAYQDNKLVGEYDETYATALTLDELKQFQTEYPGSIAAVTTPSIYGINNLDLSESARRFYSFDIKGYLLSEPSIKIVAGNLPENANEVAISDYMFAALKAGKFYNVDEDKVYVLSDYDSAIGKNIYLDDLQVRLTISGVYKGEQIPEKYKELQKAAETGSAYEHWEWESSNWEGERRNGLYEYLVCTKEFLTVHKDLFEVPVIDDGGEYTSIYDYFPRSDIYTNFYYISNETEYNFGRYGSYDYVSRYASDSGYELLPLYNLLGERISSLSTGQIGISFFDYGELYESYLSDWIFNQVDYSDQDEIYNYYNENIDPILRDLTYGGGSLEECLAKVSAVEKFLQDYNIPKPQIILRNEDSFLTRDASIGGLYYSQEEGNCYYASDELWREFYVGRQAISYEYETKYVAPEDAYITSIFVPYDHSDKMTRNLVSKTFNIAENDSTSAILNPIIDEVAMITRAMDSMAFGILIIGLVVALFAVLLMFNFISASITAKKKDIGILRAIGARTFDVFKIFFAEALIVAAICFVLSCAGSIGVCALMNWAATVDTAIISVHIFVFGPLSFLTIFAVALFTAIIATIIPVAIYSKKPPVDSIRAL